MRAGTWTPVLGPGRGWDAAGVGAGHLPPLHRAVPSLPVFRFSVSATKLLNARSLWVSFSSWVFVKLLSCKLQGPMGC